MFHKMIDGDEKMLTIIICIELSNLVTQGFPLIAIMHVKTKIHLVFSTLLRYMFYVFQSDVRYLIVNMKLTALIVNNTAAIQNSVPI